MRPSRTWLLAFLLAALLAAFLPVADAASGGLDLDGEFPLTFEGQGVVDATDSDFHATGQEGAVAFALQDGTGELTLIEHRSFEPVSGGPGPVGTPLRHDDVAKRLVGLPGRTLDLGSRGPDFQILVYGTASSLTSPGPGFTVKALRSPNQVVLGVEALIQTPAEDGDHGQFQQVTPAGAYRVDATAATLRTKSEAHVFVTGAVIILGGPEGSEILDLRQRTESRPGSVWDPLSRTWMGPGSHTESIAAYLLVDAREADVRIDAIGLASTMYAQELKVQWSGRMAVPRATGSIHTTSAEGRDSFSPEGQDVLLDGEHQVILSKQRGRVDGTEVHGRGDWSTVHYGHTAARFVVPASIGIGALALGIIAWLCAKSKALASGAGAVAAYARVHGEDILRHRGRMAIYECIQANPGITVGHLARCAGCSPSTTIYHVRVLQSNGFVALVRFGRRHYVFDRKQPGQGAAVGVVATRNRHASAIVAYLAEHPGASQRDIVGAMTLAQSTVAWHLKRLAEAHLVLEQREPPFTRYFVAGGEPNRGTRQGG